MRIVKAFIIILSLAVGASAQNYRLDSFVVGPGGGDSHSASYSSEVTAGQPIAGDMASSSYHMITGFWSLNIIAGPPPGCAYTPGDINGNGAANGIDIVYAVNYLKATGPHPPTDCGGICPEPSPFYAAGDVNGNCAFNGIDITFFVRYLKGQVPSMLSCADCPPAGPTPPARLNPPAPAVQPIRAPMLKAPIKGTTGRSE